jgi:hypothetical protein
MTFWNNNFSENVTPVLLDPKNPDFSRPGLELAFHKFAPFDGGHLRAAMGSRGD